MLLFLNIKNDIDFKNTKVYSMQIIHLSFLLKFIIICFISDYAFLLPINFFNVSE